MPWKGLPAGGDLPNCGHWRRAGGGGGRGGPAHPSWEVLLSAGPRLLEAVGRRLHRKKPGVWGLNLIGVSQVFSLFL